MAHNKIMAGESTLLKAEFIRTNVLNVSTLCFGAYLYFVLDYFLRFSARMSGYGALRPTLMVFLLICVLLFLERNKLKGKTEDPIFKVFLTLIIYLVFSLPFVEWPGSVIRANAESFVKAAAFMVFTVFIIDSEKRLRLFLWAFLGCQVFRILEPLYLNITSGYLGSKTYLGAEGFAGRLAGAPADVINPNELGFVIVTAIPFLHYFLFYGRWYAKLTYLILLPSFLYALILTMSRGAFLALLVVAWMIFKDSRHKFILLIVVVVIAVGAWGVMNPVQKDRYTSLLNRDSQQAAGVAGRIGGNIQELKLGFRKPVFGHGIGTTPEAKYHAYGSMQASHNLYAEILIEIGIIGAIIYFIFLKRIYQRFRSNRQKLKKLGYNQHYFYCRLNMAMISVFWMYIVYSLNYWGLSQYYWYLFAGLAVVFGRLLDGKCMGDNSGESA